jgi:hypothetical protein
MDRETLDLLANTPEPVTDLNTVRQKAVELRDLKMRREELENQLDELNKSIKDIERDQLPTLFSQAGIASISVEASGNYPAFEAVRNTVYGAHISEEHKEAAMKWFEDNEHGDLVRALVSVQFGVQEHEAKKKLLNLLITSGYGPQSTETVHPSQLRAFVKREIQAGHNIPQDLLGVFVFDQVTIK